MIIYKLTFRNGKVYIGQTVRTMHVRFQQHGILARGGSLLPVHCAWRKHGEPTVDIIGEYADHASLNAAEIEAIASLGTLCPGGYNVALGGHDGTVKSPLVRAKMSASSTGKRHTDETKAKMAEVSRKRWEDPEYREKVLTAVSISFTPERRAIISATAKRTHTGKAVSEETKAKLRGRILSAETRAKMSAAAKGRKKGPRSAETRAKLAASTKEFWTNPDRVRERSEQIRAGQAARTPEERSNAARRAWETKRRKANP